MFKLSNLGIEYHCAGCINVLICFPESGFVVVLGDGEVVDLEAPQTLISFGGVEGGGVVEVVVEGRDYCREAIQGGSFIRS
jgi:hypothetical protein